jgi:Carboxypeptidase regulatory-like domain
MRRPLSSSRRDATDPASAVTRQPRGSRRNGAPCRALAVLVGCVALFAVAPVAAAQAAASIKGTVTAVKSGGTLAGVEVTATSEQGGGSGFTTTIANGTYTISGLAAGEYKVRFNDPTAKYVAQNKSIFLAEGENTLNAALQEHGSISGTVTSAATGSGLGSIQVRVSGTEERFGTTEANGDYTVADLAPGNYVVEFSPSFESGYLSQSTSTTLGEGEVKNISAALKEGGKISGRVTDAVAHNGLAKIGVYVHGSSGGGFASTNANGEYTVTGLSTGSYKVEFSWEYSEAEFKACEHAPRCPPKYITQYFNNQPSEATANSVGAAEGSVTSGINAAMVPTAPVNTALPVVSGTPTVGDLLSCLNGSWTGEPELPLAVGWPLTTPFTYQWLRDGGVIAGATSAAYVVQAADVGHGLACEVSATNGAGHASAKSNQVAVTLPAVTVSSTKILVSGGSVRVPIACANATCAGTIELTEQVVVKHRKGKKKTVLLAKGSYSLAAGKSEALAVRMTAAGKGALARAKRHRLSGKVSVSVTGGVTVQKSVVVSAKHR